MISNLTDLSNFKFHSFEVVDRVSETQVQVSENLNVAIKVLIEIVILHVSGGVLGTRAQVFWLDPVLIHPVSH